MALNPRGLTEGHGAVQLLGWLCERHGVGTYIQLIDGMLDAKTHAESRNLRDRLIAMTQRDMPGLYVATMVSPSVRSAMAQILQMPGVSGLENNTVLLDNGPGVDEDLLARLVDDAMLAADTGKNVLFLRDDGSRFGERRAIDVWLTRHDERNAKLMVLLAYILAGHQDWKRARLRVFAALPGQEIEDERQQLLDLCEQGRIPIPERNIQFLEATSAEAYRSLVEEHSADADLVIVGMTRDSLDNLGGERIEQHPALTHVLFVLACEDLDIE